MGRHWDWDDVLSYSTFKTVKVRDRRLGGLHYFFMLLIVGYIVYTIFSKQLFLATESVTGGSVRTTILPPSALASPPYCDTVAGKCLYLSSAQITPTTEESTIFVTTRVSLTNATVADGCNPFAPASQACQPGFPKSRAVDYYAADVENYTIMVEHTVRGFSTAISLRNGDLRGKLLDVEGKPMRSYIPASAPPADRTDEASHYGNDLSRVVVRGTNIAGDIFSIADLLAAANVSSLNLPTKSPSGAANNETMRFAGIVLIVMVDYANMVSNPEEISYTYRVSMIQGAETKVLENHYIPVGPLGANVTMQQWNRHGIRIKFVQTGKLGQFQLITLLTNVVASFALFRIAVLIVEFLMLRVLPEKDKYSAYKYQVTEDFHTASRRSSVDASRDNMELESVPSTADSETTVPAAGGTRAPLSRSRGGSSFSLFKLKSKSHDSNVQSSTAAEKQAPPVPTVPTALLPPSECAPPPPATKLENGGWYSLVSAINAPPPPSPVLPSHVREADTAAAVGARSPRVAPSPSVATLSPLGPSPTPSGNAAAGYPRE
ncbi:hypothetical protein H9P43_006396 [Blastocladiella emersonii ATCC 22665]|nr:hypothetical protein H9P43_006396 [Blastocladiella emersonii ATCC 22665]